MTKSAIVFGATGLTGHHLLTLLTEDDRYAKILVLGRSLPDVSNPKITFIKADLFNLSPVSDKILGDDLFCCLGTTLKKAGSRQNVYKLDHDAVVEIARIAKLNGFEGFTVISAMGAGGKSNNYYLKAKTDMENDVISLGFKRLVIVRPALIDGRRDEFRLAELLGKIVMKILAPLMNGNMLKYKIIDAKTIARAMIELINTADTGTINTSDALQKFST